MENLQFSRQTLAKAYRRHVDYKLRGRFFSRILLYVRLSEWKLSSIDISIFLIMTWSFSSKSDNNNDGDDEDDDKIDDQVDEG